MKDSLCVIREDSAWTIYKNTDLARRRLRQIYDDCQIDKEDLPYRLECNWDNNYQLTVKAILKNNPLNSIPLFVNVYKIESIILIDK